MQPVEYLGYCTVIPGFIGEYSAYCTAVLEYWIFWEYILQTILAFNMSRRHTQRADTHVANLYSHHNLNEQEHVCSFSVLSSSPVDFPTIGTILSNGNVDHANGINSALTDIYNLFSLSEIGRNSLYASCSWHISSSEWFCHRRGQTHTCLDLTTGDDSALSFHEGNLLQSRLEVC
jgi:hypothetical protein